MYMIKDLDQNLFQSSIGKQPSQRDLLFHQLSAPQDKGVDLQRCLPLRR
jgi:hypothetical protein